MIIKSSLRNVLGFLCGLYQVRQKSFPPRNKLRIVRWNDNAKELMRDKIEILLFINQCWWFVNFFLFLLFFPFSLRGKWLFSFFLLFIFMLYPSCVYSNLNDIARNKCCVAAVIKWFRCFTFICHHTNTRHILRWIQQLIYPLTHIAMRQSKKSLII